MIYLDYSATTKTSKEVLDTFVKVSTDFIGNPNSLHKLGVESKKLIDASTEQIANIMGVKKDEIIYTSGASESNNTVLKGVALRYQKRGKHIITTQFEHSSIYGPISYLQTLGFEVDFVETDQDGIVKIDIALSHAGVIDSRGSGAGNGQRTPGTLPAAHGENNGLRLHLEQAVSRGRSDDLVPGQVDNGGVGDGFNAQFLRHVDKALGILRAAEGLAEAGQAEAVMDALAQNAAKLLFPLDNENVVHALLFQLDGSRKSGGASADNDYIMHFHYFTSPTNI